MKTKILFIGIAVGAVRVLFAQPEIEVQKLLSVTGKSTDRFGISVSVSGEYAIVGASGEDRNGLNTGAAYIYQKNSTMDGHWCMVATLAPDDGIAEDHFGASVSISGAYAIVGAHGDDDRGNESGSSYIYYRDQGGADNWGLVTKLTAMDGATDDRFGYSVNLSDDHAIVGAFENCENGYMSGAAYIFNRNQGGPDQWGEVKKLMAADGSELAHFGFSVAISGGYAIVGSYGDEDNGPLSGAAYIFDKDLYETDGWGECAKLTTLDGEAYSFFGISVDISDELAIVGAHKHNDSLNYSGAAYIFHRDQNGSGKWGQQAKLKADDPSPYDYFGWSTSISADYAIVGAYNDDDLGINSGSVYTFHRDPDGEGAWNHAGKLTASDGSEKCNFGKTVSLSGNYAFLGSSSTSEGTKSGSVHIFRSDKVCIYNQPESQVDVCEGSEVSFSITGTNIDIYQWQESCDAGISWTNLTDCPNTDGSASGTLTVTALYENDRNQYRCLVSNDLDQITSSPATLMIDSITPTVFCNEKITVDADKQGYYTVEGTEFDPVISSDYCNRIWMENDFNHSPSLKGTTFNPGNNVVNWTVDDGTGIIQTMRSEISVIQAVGIDDGAETSFSVYPNPTHGILKFDGIPEMVKAMVITDLSGVAVIKKGSIHQGEILDISELKPGAYILTLHLDRGTSNFNDRTNSTTIIKQ